MRPAPSTLARLLGLALAAVLAVSGLLVGTGAATAGPAGVADPMAGAPAVGDCFDLTFEQGYEHAITEAAVSCDRKHTMRVVAVGQLPAAADWDDREALVKTVRKVCDPAWERITGTEPLTYRTLWSSWFFSPTTAQKNDGARWFSCEVALSAGDKLLPLPSGTLPKAKKKPADSIARCVSRSSSFVACSSPHVLRATYTFLTTAKGSDKAKAKAVAKAADKTCQRQVKRWTGFYSGYPVSEKKAAIACYLKTTR